jgi:predicted metalloprotease with PDZ domain
MGVRTNWVESRYAHITGAGTFMTSSDGLSRPHHVSLSLPGSWKTSISGLPSGAAPHTFVAANFDLLVDSPIVAGNPAVHEFRVGGKPHFLVNVNEPDFWDVQRSVADVQKIVEEYARMWGELPYDKYVFLNILNESGGGLEHLNSTTLMASRWATSTRRRYTNWLGLVSHEYFHLWNVKRLRPIELGPFNYDEENYTKSLWISEGLADYYGSLALRRANLVSDDAYLGMLSNDIESLQTTPGRLVQPVEMASFDAWIKEYRSDENSPNVAISYYTKGAVVGFLLDAKIRRATGGQRSLDDVMRGAYKRFSGPRGFTPAEFRQVVNEVAGADLGDWMRRALETTEELDYREALDWFGLRFTTAAPARTSGQIMWQGLRLRNDNNRLVVTQVRRGTPAYESGVTVDDELVALDDFRVRPDQWDARVETYREGQSVSVLVARRDELMRFDLTIAPPQMDEWEIRAVPDATPAQRRQREAWLGSRP